MAGAYDMTAKSLCVASHGSVFHIQREKLHHDSKGLSSFCPPSPDIICIFVHFISFSLSPSPMTSFYLDHRDGERSIKVARDRGADLRFPIVQHPNALRRKAVNNDRLDAPQRYLSTNARAVGVGSRQGESLVNVNVQPSFPCDFRTSAALRDFQLWASFV